MSIGKNYRQRIGETSGASDPTNQPGRFSWLRTRGVIILGAILLGTLLIVFGNGSSRATSDRVEAAAQSQNDPLSVRAYQFTGQGQLQGGSSDTWIISGIPVIVNSNTQIEGEVHPSDAISILGHITKNGDWVAERVMPISESESFFSFAGPLEAREQNVWRVAGFSLLVNAQTQVGEAILENELVLVTFKALSDGTWLALKIEALSALEQSRTPTPTANPSPTPSPTPIIEPTASTQKPAVSKPAEQKSSTNQSNTITVCHKPGGKKGGQTIVIEQSALNGHLDHGDTLGACSNSGGKDSHPKPKKHDK